MENTPKSTSSWEFRGFYPTNPSLENKVVVLVFFFLNETPKHGNPRKSGKREEGVCPSDPRGLIPKEFLASAIPKKINPDFPEFPPPTHTLFFFFNIYRSLNYIYL